MRFHPAGGFPEAGDGLGLQNDTGIGLICHAQIFLQINIPGTQRKMIFFGGCVVEMEVAEPVSVLHDNRFILPSNTVVMTNVKGQGKHRAFQQDGKGLLLKGSVSAAVFHTDFDIERANHFLTFIPEKAHILQILVYVFLKQENFPVGEREIDTLGEVHVQHRDMQPFRNVDSLMYCGEIRVGHMGV